MTATPDPAAPALERVLSPSRAADFLQCPLLFRLRTIDRLPESPRPAAVRGTLVHAVLDRLFALPAARRTAEEAVAMLEPQWDRMCAEAPELEDMFDDVEAMEEWLGQAGELLHRYFAMERPELLEPRERELRLETTLDSGLRLRGYVDRLDVAPGGEMRIVDYKTGKAPPQRFTDKARFQIFFYAVLVWRTYGEVPKRLQLMYLKDGGWLWYEPSEAELRAAEEEILHVWSRIEEAAAAGQWPPRRSRLCDWCDHQALCPEFGGTPPPLPA